MSLSTPQLYDEHAGGWRRDEPRLLSDFTARPSVLALCEPIAGARVLDLGCGEGYVARQLVRRGAARVEGIDISAGMIQRAREREATEPLGITYHVGDAVDLDDAGDASFELALAVFLFNYLTIDEMTSVVRSVHRILRPGGRFVFSVPHPSVPFLRSQEPPFYFDPAGAGYFSGRDRLFEGRIWGRNGSQVPVRCVHKTLADYFAALAAGGFTRMPIVKELGVTPEQLALDGTFFGPAADCPLHLAFSLER